MPDSQDLGQLFVEGKDDCHAILHLLARHNIILDENEGPVVLRAKGSDAQVVDSITVAVKGSGKHPVGFVIDSDLTVEQRWASVRSRLAAVEVLMPNPPGLWTEELPSGGFVSRSAKYDRTVGVWIMPNNRLDYGKIEDLLATLVPPNDDLFAIATAATAQAILASEQLPAPRKGLKAIDAKKGQLHSWLAWQELPGMSFGHALRRKYFNHESDVANAFVTWFSRLFPSVTQSD